MNTKRQCGWGGNGPVPAALALRVAAAMSEAAEAVPAPMRIARRRAQERVGWIRGADFIAHGCSSEGYATLLGGTGSGGARSVRVGEALEGEEGEHLECHGAVDVGWVRDADRAGELAGEDGRGDEEGERFGTDPDGVGAEEILAGLLALDGGGEPRRSGIGRLRVPARRLDDRDARDGAEPRGNRGADRCETPTGAVT